MRLTCPNCAAQYEVPKSALPSDGGDVQCSDCGKTWFARPVSNVPVEDQPAVQHPRPAPKPAPRPYPPAADDMPNPPKRALSDQARSVLQQEVDREMATRRAEAEAELELQTDLGLDDIAPVPPITGRAALPEVEDVTRDVEADLSDLEPRQKPKPDRTVNPKQKRRRFRIGFWSVILILSILTSVYVNAEAIKTQVPAVGPYLDQAVAYVDMGRAWLTQQAGRTQLWIDSLIRG